MSGFLQVIADLLGILHCNRVFGDGGNDGDDVDLLYAQNANTGIALQIGALHLSGDENDGRGIEPGAGNAGHGIGSARPRCHHRRAQPVGDARMGFRRNGNRLLMQIANVFESLAPAERVIQVHGAAAGEHEHVADLLPGKKFHHIIGELHQRGHNQFPAP